MPELRFFSKKLLLILGVNVFVAKKFYFVHFWISTTAPSNCGSLLLRISVVVRSIMMSGLKPISLISFPFGLSQCATLILRMELSLTL